MFLSRRRYLCTVQSDIFSQGVLLVLPFAWETKNFRFYGNIDTARKPPKINKKKCKSFTRRVLRLCSTRDEFKNHQLKQRIGLSADLQIKWCILTWQCHPSNSCWPFGCFHFFFNNVSLSLPTMELKEEGGVEPPAAKVAAAAAPGSSNFQISSFRYCFPIRHPCPHWWISVVTNIVWSSIWSIAGSMTIMIFWYYKVSDFCW